MKTYKFFGVLASLAIILLVSDFVDIFQRTSLTVYGYWPIVSAVGVSAVFVGACCYGYYFLRRHENSRTLVKFALVYSFLILW